ncbi:hypothetical protein APX70_03341, partial [Pseudomonas syringae pv. maculicola]
ARQVKDVKIRQGSRNSYPVYDDKGQKITGWRERAELRLESADFAVLSKLTGELLTDLKMGGMDFSISPSTRKTSEDALLKDAVTAFKARAQLVTEALGGKGYKLVNLNLNTSGYPQPYLRAPVMMMAKSSRDESAPSTAANFPPPSSPGPSAPRQSPTFAGVSSDWRQASPSAKLPTHFAYHRPDRAIRPALVYLQGIKDEPPGRHLRTFCR